MPDELVAQMGKMGFFGIMIDAEHGGLGLGLFEYVLVTEELARAWMSVASIIARGNGHGGQFPASLRDELVPRVARGEYLGATAISEPDAGSDVASIRTRAERVGDEWVLNGQKMWCTFADRADYLIVYARTTPYDPERRQAGIRSFYIPKERGSFPPGMTGNPIRKIGYHGWKTWELSFNDVRVPERVPARRGERRRRRRQGGLQEPVAGAVDGAGAHRRPLASGSPAARWRTPSPTRRSASSSTSRSATSRPSASRSPTWRRRSRRAGRSCTRSPPTPTPATPSTTRRRW